jgi:tetratricopeptide (TPR) repeat protein
MPGLEKMALFYLLFGVAWLSAMAWLLFYRRFTRLLQDKHPGLLNEIGELPALGQRLVLPGEIRGLSGLIGFLLSKRYLRSTDRELVDKATSGRRIFIFSCFSMLLMFALLPSVILQENARGSTAVRNDTATQTAVAEEAERLYRDNRFEEALRLLDPAIAADPDNATLLYWRGLTREKLGMDDGAIGDFARVVAKVPEHFSSYQHLDYLLFQQGRTDEIITWWNRYLAEVPDDANAYLERGGTWFRVGNNENAAADARRACELGNGEGCQRYRQLKGETP